MYDQRLQQQIDQHPYPLLFTTISGAHLYGFPSPDSDYDLRSKFVRLGGQAACGHLGGTNS